MGVLADLLMAFGGRHRLAEGVVNKLPDSALIVRLNVHLIEVSLEAAHHGSYTSKHWRIKRLHLAPAVPPTR